MDQHDRYAKRLRGMSLEAIERERERSEWMARSPEASVHFKAALIQVCIQNELKRRGEK